MILLSRKGATPAPSRFIGSLYALAISALLGGSCFAQGADVQHPSAVTSLSELLKEAEQNNPQIQAWRQGFEAARQVPAQVTALPDPMFQIQQVNVGSPRPFAGYTNSEFAYIGLGASQDIPYPGKLRLRGEIAQREADIAGSRADSVSLGVLAAIKTAYYQLAYLSQTLSILENDREILKQVELAADARYRSGLGNQQNILQAQFQQTKLSRHFNAPPRRRQTSGAAQAARQPLSDFARHRSRLIRGKPASDALRRNPRRRPGAKPRPRRHAAHH